MYGVPEDLPLRRFVGDFLTQVSFGMDGVHFQFGSSGTISVEGRWDLQDAAGRVVDQSMEHADRDAHRLHVISTPTSPPTGSTRLDPSRSRSAPAMF